MDWLGAFPITTEGEKDCGVELEYEEVEDLRSRGRSDSDDGPQVREYPEFNENLEQFGEVTLENSYIFSTTKYICKALLRYSVYKHFDYIYLKYDKIRVQARCVEDDWEFYIFALKMKE